MQSKMEVFKPNYMVPDEQRPVLKSTTFLLLHCWFGQHWHCAPPAYWSGYKAEWRTKSSTCSRLHY